MPIVVKVKDVMDRNVITLEAKKSALDALNSMIKNRVWSIIVTREGLPVGVVTERDILRRVVSKGLNVSRVRVEEIMSTPLITITPDEPIGRAMELMALKKIRRVYVVDRGKIIGRVTQTEAFTYILNVLIALHDIAYLL